MTEQMPEDFMAPYVRQLVTYESLRAEVASAHRFIAILLKRFGEPSGDGYAVTIWDDELRDAPDKVIISTVPDLARRNTIVQYEAEG